MCVGLSSAVRRPAGLTAKYEGRRPMPSPRRAPGYRQDDSCFYEVAILRLTTVDKVIDFLGPVFTRYGVKSDNGSQFVSQVFKDFLVEDGIEH